VKRLGGTLLSKVFLVQAVVLCLVAVLVPLGIDAMLRERVSYFERKVLSDRATLLTEAMALDANGALEQGPTRYDREGERGEFGFAVVDAQGKVHLATTAFAAGILQSLPRGSEDVFSSIERDAVNYVTISRPISIGGRPFWLLLGWNTNAQNVIFDDVVRGFLWRALALTVPLLALLLVLNALIVRRFFRPVLRLSRQIRSLDPARMEGPLPADDLPDEVQPLVRAYNDALEKVERSFRLQKEFTADAAHELRTPMAVLDARLQTLPASETRDALLADVRLMTRIVNQLLDMAKLDQANAPVEQTDLLAVCQSIVGALAPEAIAKGQNLGLIEPEDMKSLPVLAHEQDVWHMVRNLVENAIRHTPAGTTIDVILENDGTLTVKDDGPGIPKEFHEHIFKRFWRRKRSGGSGAGLGMAIVQRVAQSNGGSITFQSDEGQGTAFVVRLPRGSSRP
jgi:signal transduction histidine kinase